MGQYYHPICTDTLTTLFSHDFSSGLKLMEHSYIDNNFVSAVMQLLCPTGPWHKKRLIWCGDYADIKMKDVIKDEARRLVTNLNGNNDDLYHYCQQRYEVRPTGKLDKNYQFIINHSKQKFVCLTKLIPNKEGWTIHPLPLLTSAGNGNGGGDYEGSGMKLVGSWANDVISVDTRAPPNYTEVVTNFNDTRFSKL